MKRSPIEWFRRFTARFSEAPTSVLYSFGAFLFFVNLRNMIEFWFLGLPTTADHLLHYNLFYFSLALALALWLHLITRRGIVSMLKLVFPGFIVTLVPPLLDATVFGFLEGEFDYLVTYDWSDLGSAYVTWFGPIGGKGVTAGMRVEIALVTITASFYAYAVTGGLLRTLLAGLGAYTILFVSLAMPGIILTATRQLEWTWRLSLDEYTRVLPFDTGLLLIACFARGARELFRVLVRDSRPLRIVHYELMFILGLFAHHDRIEWNDFGQVLRVTLAFSAIILVWIFAVMNNNVHDLELDRINAPDRPLVTGVADPASYERFSWVVGLLSLAFAAAAGEAAFLLTLVFGAAYFTYSTPPLRLKEKCFVSKWVIGLNSVACLMMGYSMQTGRFDAPAIIGWGVLIWFSFGSHLIDLKDIEGDKAAGIRNVSTMLGIDRAKKLLGGSAMVLHVVVGVLLGFNWLGVAIAVAGVLQFVVINRKQYREMPVLLLQNSVSLAVVVFVAMNPVHP